MKKTFLLLIYFAASHITLLAQSAAQVKVDSLRKVLPALKDSARVDCLLELAAEHWYLSPDRKRDSSYHYTIKANQEAVKIGYQYGKAMSLLELSRYEMFVKKNLVTSRAYLDSASRIGEKIKNDKVLGQAYLTLVDIYGNNKIRDEQKILECLIKSQNYFQKAGDKLGELEATTWLCTSYANTDQYEEGFDYCDKCFELSKFLTAKSSSWQRELPIYSFISMSGLYSDAGDYETALEYLMQSEQYHIINKAGWSVSLLISDVFCQLKQYDSAMHYFRKWEKAANPAVPERGYMTLGQIYLETGRYDEAILKLKECIAAMEKWEKEERGRINPYFYFRSYTLISKSYMKKKNWRAALKYATEGFNFAQKEKLPLSLIEGHEVFSEIYHALGKDDKAYVNLRQYTILKDSIINRQFLWRLSSYKKEAEAKKKKAEIELLNKDNQIKDEKLKRENLLINFLMAGMVALALISVFVFRTLRLKQKNERLNRSRLEDELKVQLLESQKHEAELRQQASELEMQALRAQMNPHFIFNCLSSINCFILKNESETASDYLTRFSRLIRLVLSNSKRPLVFLEDELEMLRLYIEMERLRFKNSFDFNISFKNEIDTSAIPIPPLLLQPFVENAIWHGLMNKDGHGQLDIAFAYDDSILTCIITDNGVGRIKAKELKSKKDVKGKSMGLQITAERLAKLNKQNKQDTFFTVKDLYDDDGHAAGTEVVLTIRLEESMREVVAIPDVFV